VRLAGQGLKWRSIQRLTRLVVAEQAPHRWNSPQMAMRFIDENAKRWKTGAAEAIARARMRPGLSGHGPRARSGGECYRSPAAAIRARGCDKDDHELPSEVCCVVIVLDTPHMVLLKCSVMGPCHHT